MPRDEKRRQRAIMKKRRKDKERKKRYASSGGGIYSANSGLIKKAREFPIYESLINADWQERGLAEILLSRRQPNNNLIIGVYLVDIFCLGLKNTFSKSDISIADYEYLKLNMFGEDPIINCEPGLVNKIVYGAIDYARNLGFEPHEDFELSQFILNEPSDEESSFNVEFGKNGRPFYIQGPEDDVDYIIETLTENVGEGNFDYMILFR